jgi:hypothetical protein
MTRFADFLDELSAKDENLREWASWCRTISVPLAIASIRSGALGPDLQRAALCLTAQSRSVWCAKALEGFALEYSFNLDRFTQPETERVTRYLELLAHAAQS